MFDGNRVRGCTDEPKPFSLSEWEVREPSPVSRTPIPKLAGLFRVRPANPLNEYDLAPAPKKHPWSGTEAV
jgi:hypothetical protein